VVRSQPCSHLPHQEHEVFSGGVRKQLRHQGAGAHLAASASK
jgi:hypothetical protein